LTWGRHEATSEFRHVTRVIMVGVMQRSRVDIAASALGQLQKLSANVTASMVTELLVSEAAHAVLQAASRGACRQMQDGKAGAMKAYLISDLGPKIRRKLEPVTPGATWLKWDGPEKKRLTQAERAEGALDTILDELEAQHPQGATVPKRRVFGHILLV
jgi:hypothetical protein